ncbi:MAG: T9SS type A sorting domain-containing protein [Bacteroidia bacterium]
MKKIYTFIIFYLLSTFLKAQTVNFYLTSDSVVYGATAMQSFAATADIVNNSQDSVIVEAVRLINIVPVSGLWETAICVGGNCYSWIDTITFTIHAGATKQFLMYFRYLLHNTDTAHTYIQFKSITPGITFEQYQNFYGMDSLVLLTGISSISNPKLQASISPNPFSGELAVRSSETGEIKIKDIYGRLGYVQKLQTVNSKLQTVNWSNGIYFVEVITQKERVVGKVVKE